MTETETDLMQAFDDLTGKAKKALTRHDDGEDTFPTIKQYWEDPTEEKTALRMVLFKLARIQNKHTGGEDSYVDALGYLVLAYMKFKQGK